MAETTADVRRDIELTRERMSSTLDQLERKLNVSQIVKDNPWPAVGVAFGAGLLLSGTRSDVKAAGVTLAATRGAVSALMAAELIVRSPELGLGLGGLLDQGRQLQDMPTVFLGILAILLVGIAVELLLFAPLERRVLTRRGLLLSHG